MSTYTDNGSAVSIGVQGYASHADSAGLERRLRVLASHADRATMLRILEERDIGCVTLTMPKWQIAARRDEGAAKWCKNLIWERRCGRR